MPKPFVINVFPEYGTRELGDEYLIRAEGAEFRSPHPARNAQAVWVLENLEEESR